MALASGNTIEAADLQLSRPPTVEEPSDLSALPLQEHLDRVEKEAILKALDQTRYNRTAAAKLLGITFRALRYRMERLGIN